MTRPAVITAAEHFARVRRVQSVACPGCGAQPGQQCRTPAGFYTPASHAARWHAYYLEARR